MRVLLSLGANEGQREAALGSALEALAAWPGLRLLRVSGCYETSPVGITDQPDFLNAAAEIETALPPLELLNAVKRLEVQLGRRPGRRWGPRIIDIDIILYGDVVVATEALILPHPLFRERAFVLRPLAEIAPDAVDPVTGETIAALARARESAGRVERRGEVPRTP